MAIVFVYTVYSILIVLYESAAYSQIERNLCLETAVLFMYGHKKCDFNKKFVQNSLENETTCQTKCEVKLEGINDDDNTLWLVDITFGSGNYYINPCPNNEDHHNMLTMFINCSKWNAVNVPVGGYCKLNEQCQGSEHLVVCDHGRCVCRDGYLLSNLECHEDLKITSASSLQRNQEETNIGATLGALFGGLLLGVILTTAVVMIIYRRLKKDVNKRELNVTFAGSDSNAKFVGLSDLQTKDKTQEVSPYSCLRETSVYDHASENPINGQTQDDVYNHLHEQGKQDNVNYYDHTCATTAHNGDMSDYSHLRHATS